MSNPKLHLKLAFAGGPVILTLANETAVKGGERTTGAAQINFWPAFERIGNIIRYRYGSCDIICSSSLLI